jgi:hypothetical protein
MCDVCVADPLTHSFDPITMVKQTHVFYTTFKGIKDHTNIESIYRHFKTYLDRIQGAPWLWIIDCRFLGSKQITNINTAFKILEKLGDQYHASIQFMYLINAGPIIKTCMQVFAPLITKKFANKILKLNGSPLELFEEFKKLGWSVPEIHPLIHRIQKEFD